MRIGILGQPCIDEIITPDGKMQTRSLGGILYSYAAMERAMETSNSEDSFLPLTWNSTPDAAIFDSFYSGLRHIAARPLWNTPQLTNRVRLIYSSEADRIEHCANVLPPLTPTELAEIDLSTLDGIFVNMISGFDITLDTLLWIRKHAPNTHIHLDIHALILGDLSSQIGVGRVPKGQPNWREWIGASDSVQMNELETRWIASPEIESEDTLIQTLRECYRSEDGWRTKFVIVTKAERGATAYSLSSFDVTHFAPPATTVIETTGSGDVFGAQFLYELLKTGDIGLATKSAIDAASYNATLRGVEALVNRNS